MTSLPRTLLFGGALAAAAFAVRRTTTGWHPDPMDDIYGGRALPLVIAHRGASGVAPENTLPSFQAAIDQGADGIELDGQLTADGEVVVHHDFVLGRTANGQGAIRKHTLAELKQLDAGAWFSRGKDGPARFTGTQIPTLAEVLELVRGKMAVVNIEIKTDDRLGDPALVSGAVDVIARSGMRRKVLVSSFNPLALWHLRRLDSRVRVGLLYSDDQPLYKRARWFEPLVRPNALHPVHRLATPDQVALAHARGMRVNVWTLNEEAELQRYAAAGVDAVITDYPDRAIRARAAVAPTT
jgi:glycerophosphoryl diester phosphodiesterase